MKEPGFWEGLRELLTGGRRMLDCVQVEVSSRCHGRCTYCPHTCFEQNWRSRHMPVETFERLWPLVRRAGRVHLQGWGEPLLNPDFFELASLSRRAGCAVSTTTCGLGVTDETARRLVDSGMDVVAFSLTGTDAAGNAARRGVPFEKVVAAIELLQKERRARGAVHMEIHIAYLLLWSNLSDVRRLPPMMQRLGVHAAVISTLDYLPDASLENEAFPPGEPQKIAAAELVLGNAAAEARRRGMAFDYRLPQWDRPAGGCRENIGRSLFVSAEGDVSPCVLVNIPSAAAQARRRIFGNVNTEEPLAIWDKPAYRAFRHGPGGDQKDAACRACPKRF